MSAGAQPSVAEVLRPLRSATHALHEALDSRLPIARENASLADYAAHLRALRPWLEAVRQALAAPAILGWTAWRGAQTAAWPRLHSI
ncbi:hypothetical protein [Variovorax durovernensis]